MNMWRWIAVGAAVVGLASGQGSLESAAAAQPPLGWGHLAFVFIGSIIGMILVVGFQLMRKDEKYGRWAFRFMTPITIFIAGSGLGALGVALYSGRHGPAAWLFLACGAGALLGLWACWAVKQRRATVAP
jgi:predicted membrane channel-forming protein YqfA (hemolysin III family)